MGFSREVADHGIPAFAFSKRLHEVNGFELGLLLWSGLLYK